MIRPCQTLSRIGWQSFLKEDDHDVSKHVTDEGSISLRTTNHIPSTSQKYINVPPPFHKISLYGSNILGYRQAWSNLPGLSLLYLNTLTWIFGPSHPPPPFHSDPLYTGGESRLCWSVRWEDKMGRWDTRSHWALVERQCPGGGGRMPLSATIIIPNLWF